MAASGFRVRVIGLVFVFKCASLKQVPTCIRKPKTNTFDKSIKFLHQLFLVVLDGFRSFQMVLDHFRSFLDRFSSSQIVLGRFRSFQFVLARSSLQQVPVKLSKKYFRKFLVTKINLGKTLEKQVTLTFEDLILIFLSFVVLSICFQKL